MTWHIFCVTCSHKISVAQVWFAYAHVLAQIVRVAKSCPKIRSNHNILEHSFFSGGKLLRGIAVAENQDQEGAWTEAREHTVDTRDYVSCALVRCNSIHRGLLGVIMCLDVINVPVRTCSLLSLLMLLLLAALFPFLFSLFSLSFLSAACQNSLINRPSEIGKTISVNVNIQYLLCFIGSTNNKQETRNIHDVAEPRFFNSLFLF